MFASSKARSAARGFTLVELLVVIGIIALLVAILLPALTAAKKQANAVKCASQLRELGNAFQLYAIESKGWYPVALLTPGSGRVYNIDGVNFPQGGVGAYWFNFLAKYMTKGKVGTAAATVEETIAQRSSVFWGCPSWDGYRTTALGGYSRVQTGYGMNLYPTMSVETTGLPPAADRVNITGWGTASETGKFFNQRVWARHASERALLADSLFWQLTAQAVPATGVMAGQQLLNNSGADFSYLANTSADAYRHGTYPERATSTTFSTTGGKVSFNILYVDGHVSGSNDRAEAFRSVRMKFPG